jgi:hypothetical protein
MQRCEYTEEVRIGIELSFLILTGLAVEFRSIEDEHMLIYPSCARL